MGALKEGCLEEGVKGRREGEERRLPSREISMNIVSEFLELRLRSLGPVCTLSAPCRKIAVPR